MATHASFSFFLETLESLAVVLELGPEGFQAFAGFFLFALDKLLFDSFGIVIDCAGEGC